MTVFHYRALTDGNRDEGTIEADGHKEAARLLARRGIRPFEIVENDRRKPSLLRRDALRSKGANYGRMFQDLDILMTAGFTVDAALSAISLDTRKPREADTINRILRELRAGHSLSKAFAKAPRLPEEIIPLLESGEGSGRIDRVIAAIAADLSRQEARRAALVEALVYPAFLLFAMIIAIGVVTFYLAPSLMPIFDGAEDRKPLILSILAAVDDWVRGNLDLLAIGLLTVIAGLILAFRQPVLRARIFAAIGRLPILGTILHKHAMARYLQAAGLLTGNGVPFNQALELAIRACPIHRYHPRLQEVRQQVLKGESFIAGLKVSGLLDGATLALLSVGEDANRLPDMLERAAFLLERDATTRVDRILKLLTPAITLLMGLLIGGLVISVMSAILGINDMALQ